MSAVRVELPPSMRYAVASNQIPICFEGHPDMELQHRSGDFRGVKYFEHAHLCAVLGIDPCTYWFDLPSSMRGIGANMTGYGGCESATRKSGFVMRGSRQDPVVVGKITVCSESDKFKDVDPSSARDFEDLGHR